MAKVNEIKVINHQNVPFVVDELPTEIKALVAQYNEWLQELEDQKVALTKTEMALQFLGGRIMAAMDEHVKAQQPQEPEAPEA
jgi:hypothetical protein